MIARATLGQAVLTEGRVEAWVVHPRTPRHIREPSGTEDDTPIPLDVLSRHARRHGMLVLAKRQVVGVALPTHRQLRHKPTPLGVPIHIPHEHNPSNLCTSLEAAPAQPAASTEGHVSPQEG